MRIILTLIVAVLVSAPSASLAQTSPSATVDDAAAAGWQALQDNNGELALRQFEAARRARPKDAVLQLGSGAAAHMLGRDDDAMQALRSALDQDPSLVIASKLLAEIAWQRGDLALAIDTYERALAHAPGNIEMASRLDRLQSESARRSSAAQLKISSTGPRQDPVVDRASRVLNGAYWQVARLVGAYPAEVISIELDATKPFQARVPAAVRVAANSAAGEGSAANGDAADRPICVNAKDALADAEAFDRVLTATLVQAMVNHMAPTGVPAWFPRGLAQVVATADASLARRRVRALGEIPWARLSTSPGQGDEQADSDVSLLVVRALLARIGAKSTRLLDDLSDGATLDAALAQFGFSWADLQADVVKSLEQ